MPAAPTLIRPLALLAGPRQQLLKGPKRKGDAAVVSTGTSHRLDDSFTGWFCLDIVRTAWVLLERNVFIQFWLIQFKH